MDIPSLIAKSLPLTIWSHLPITQGYTCFTSTTSLPQDAAARCCKPLDDIKRMM